MKILFADNGQSLRGVLSQTLEPVLRKAGFELLTADNSEAALQLLQRPDGPSIVVVDSSLPTSGGVTFCRQVREKEGYRRPHVIYIAPGGDIQRVLEGLEAGADDGIGLTATPPELLARINSGARALRHQQRLHQEILKREQFIKQHNLTVLPPQTAADRAAAQAAVQGTLSHAPTLQQITDALFPIADLENIVNRTLADMGLGDPAVVKDTASNQAFTPEIGLVHFIILPQKNAWLDLLLETDNVSALNLYKSFTGMDDPNVPQSDLVDVIGETLNMIQGTLKATFKSKGTEVLIPLVPQSIQPSKVPIASTQNAIHSRHLYRLGDIQLRFTLFAYFSPPTMKALKEIKIANVLAEPLRPAESSDLVLINKGTMLNTRFLKKVSDLAEFSARATQHPVFEGSPLTALLNQ